MCIVILSEAQQLHLQVLMSVVFFRLVSYFRFPVQNVCFKYSMYAVFVVFNFFSEQLIAIFLETVLFIVTILVTRVASQLYPYNANVFNGCDYFETIELGRVYDVFSPYYPEKYPPGTNCRWSGCAPYGTNIVIKCTDMRIPSVI